MFCLENNLFITWKNSHNKYEWQIFSQSNMTRLDKMQIWTKMKYKTSEQNDINFIHP